MKIQLLLFLTLSFSILLSAQGQGIHLYVSTTGSDSNPGNLAHPFLTMDKALHNAENFKNQHIDIELRKGTYYLDSTLEINNKILRNCSLKISSYQNEKVLVSAGRKLNLDWKHYSGQIYQAIIPKGIVFERLYVNEILQVLARYPNYDSLGGIFNGSSADAISEKRFIHWRNPVGGYVHALQTNEWGSVHFQITGVSSEGVPLLDGGWQINRSHTLHPKYQVVENIFEELDTVGEWYLDRSKSILYYWPPKGLNLSDALIEVSRFKNSIELKGDSSNPIEHVELNNLHFVHNERSFMQTKELILRSDWSIYRGAAVVFDGTKNCTVTNCSFEQIGGNAIILNNYNKDAIIRNCLIDHIGANAILVLGNPSSVRSPIFSYNGFIPFDQIDKTKGPVGNDFPQNCLIIDNLIHDIGLIEKQVAGVDIDMASDIRVSHNTIYNTPRAGINIGDGCWGGDIIEFNDVFNTVLETGDNGAFNSWGRDRFWNANRHYMDSLVGVHPELILLDMVKPNILRNNRFHCDHGWDIDLDDGSSNYKIYDNVCLNGGIKLREGFQRIVTNNILINNSFHPHVWFKNSGDVFKSNIIMRKYFPIGIHYWGKSIDYNLFGDSLALIASQNNGVDKHSLYGNPHFKDPVNGNYLVLPPSKALKLGFHNFLMDEFGVRDPALKKIAKHPLYPILRFTENSTNKEEIIAFLGGSIKSVNGLGERSAFGLPDDKGVIIISIGSNSLLSKSGLSAKDVIRSVNGKSVENCNALIDIIQSLNYKGKTNLGVIRNQQLINITLFLK